LTRFTQKKSDGGRLVRGLFMATILAFGTVTPDARAEDDRFSGYEIRVIRPRFMTKSNRLELGGQGVFILNQSFIYSLMASGLLDYHFSESFAFEINGAFGLSFDKQDKTLLKRDFQITTQILRTSYMAAGGILWTPVYGKTQLPTGDVVYFDSFLSFEAGMTGIAYDYAQCVAPDVEKPAPTTKSYPGAIVGFGQKYFLSEDTAIRWDVRDNFFVYQVADGSCNPGVSTGTDFQQNVTLQFGMSTFF
jgi:outer membrane beta-barrel protein